jgi:hypothetical protein
MDLLETSPAREARCFVNSPISSVEVVGLQCRDDGAARISLRRTCWPARLARPSSCGARTQRPRASHRSETKPDENAERRVHARGGFGVGQEEKPAEDAENRAHPGTFGDTKPTT